MLRSLSIRNFVVVAALDVEFGEGLTVLTGETGAGKSILLDAMGLLLGDRFEVRQIRAGAERAELAAGFDVTDAPPSRAWLAEKALVSDGDEVLLRRVLDAQGSSRAWINGSAATLAQLECWARCSSPSMASTRISRSAAGDPACRLVDAFGGFTTLAQRSRRTLARVACGGRAARRGGECRGRDGRRTRVPRAAPARARDAGGDRNEWSQLSAAQSRLAHAAELIATATDGAPH